MDEIDSIKGKFGIKNDIKDKIKKARKLRRLMVCARALKGKARMRRQRKAGGTVVLFHFVSVSHHSR